MRKISVQNSHFSSGKMKTPGGLNLKIQYFSLYMHNLLIHIENCSFTDLSYGILPVTDSMTKATALSVKVMSYPYYGRNTNIKIQNCTFQNNHKALRVFGLTIDNFSLSNCLFRNIHLFEGIGAALYLALAGRFSRTQSYISDYLFKENSAGFTPEDVKTNANILYESDSRVLVVLNRSTAFKVMLGGKGGAIALSKSQIVLLENVKFNNNSANEFGGSVFSIDTNNGELVILNCIFTSGFHTAQHGDIIYSTGKLELQSASFNMTQAKSDVTIIEHSSNKMSFYNASLLCPPGKNLEMSNLKDSQYSNEFHDLDAVNIKCVDCERGFYSRSGIFRNNVIKSDACSV